MATQPANSDTAISAISGNPETNDPTRSDKIAQPPVCVESQQLHRELTQLADAASDANAFYSALFNIASHKSTVWQCGMFVSRPAMLKAQKLAGLPSKLVQSQMIKLNFCGT